MYVILGASGHTGHIAAKNLLARGEKVRVVGRNAARLQPLAAEGAEVFHWRYYRCNRPSPKLSTRRTQPMC